MPRGAHAERRGAVPAGETSESRASVPAPYDEDGVIDGWIASLTPDQFERTLAVLARTCNGAGVGRASWRSSASSRSSSSS